MIRLGDSTVTRIAVVFGLRGDMSRVPEEIIGQNLAVESEKGITSETKFVYERTEYLVELIDLPALLKKFNYRVVRVSHTNEMLSNMIGITFVSGDSGWEGYPPNSLAFKIFFNLCSDFGWEIDITLDQLKKNGEDFSPQKQCAITIYCTEGKTRNPDDFNPRLICHNNRLKVETPEQVEVRQAQLLAS